MDLCFCCKWKSKIISVFNNDLLFQPNLTCLENEPLRSISKLAEKTKKSGKIASPQITSGAPSVNFPKMPVRKMIRDLEFSGHLL